MISAVHNCDVRPAVNQSQTLLQLTILPPVFSGAPWLLPYVHISKAVFGCKTLDQICSESPAEKDAPLPNLVRVCGFIKGRC